MTVDLIILVLVLLSAVAGAISGAARQIAQVAALVAAWLAAGPLGEALGPRLAEALGGPLLLGLICATVLVFFVVLLGVRLAISWVLRQLLGSDEPERRWLDSSLGLLLGGLKAALLAWVVLSALTFAEEHIQVAGRRIAFSSRGSTAFGLSRQLNLFELVGLVPSPLEAAPLRSRGAPAPGSPDAPARSPHPR